MAMFKESFVSTSLQPLKNVLLILLSAGFIVVSCSDNSSGPNTEPEPQPDPDPEPEATVGNLEIITITTGLDPDPRGYSVNYVDDVEHQIEANGTVTFEELEEGEYSVELREVPEHCTVFSENPVSVVIEADETRSVEFEVECKGIFRNKIVFFRPQFQEAKVQNSTGTESYFTMNPDGSDISKAADLTQGGRVHFLSDISPDGTQMVVAFSERRNGSRSNFRIAIIDAYDNSINYLIEESEDTNYFHPVFSPDGNKIAFSGYSDRGLFGHIYVMDADGSNVMKVTDTENLDQQPSWSPDGTRLIFQRSSPDYKNLGLFTVSINGTDERLISNSDYDFQSPKWSPDGSKIVVTGSKNKYANFSSIYVMNSDGSNIEKIVSKEGEGLFHGTPKWSPDGAYILFSSNREGEPDEEFGYSYLPYDLFRVSSDGSDILNLTNSSDTSESNVMWSPVND